MTAAATGLPVSIQVRLVRHAKAIGMDPNLVLARFAVEPSSIVSPTRGMPSASCSKARC